MLLILLRKQLSGVMNKFLWILVVLCACLASWTLSSTASCPHDRFLAKHVCNDCRSEEAALQYSRNRPDPGPLNTVVVLDGSPDYSLDFRNGERICKAEADVAMVWQCRTDRGYCNKQRENQRCTFHHAVNNGHFFYQWMTC